MARGVSLLFLATLLCCSLTRAWMTTTSTSTSAQRKRSALSASSSPEPNSSSRRSWLLGVSLSALVAPILIADAAVAASSDDPFAELDAIAEKIQSSSNFPNSISPLPTYKKQTEKDVTSNKEESSNTKSSPTSSSEQPLDMADFLQESRKRKQVNPLTHG